jgi:hypothetical protein
MPGKCLFLVSSSANREYVLDCLEALALPRGIIQHFRYRSKYVDEQLWDSLKSESEQLETSLRGLPIVVVYLFQTQTAGQWNPASTMGPGGPYLPLRNGRLIHAFKDGGIAHFFFELTGYVREDEKCSARVRLNDKIKFQLASSKASYAHISEELGFDGGKEGDTLGFQSIVDEAYLSGEWRTRSLGSAPLDVTYDIIFFRVTGFFREDGTRLVELIPKPKSVQGCVFAEYEIQAGATYHIRLTTHLAARVPAHLPGEGRAKLKLEFDPEVITPLGPTSLRISSLYDLEYWSFVAKPARVGRSTLNVICVHDIQISREDFMRKELLCPQISFPIWVVSAAEQEKNDGRG